MKPGERLKLKISLRLGCIQISCYNTNSGTDSTGTFRATPLNKDSLRVGLRDPESVPLGLNYLASGVPFSSLELEQRFTEQLESPELHIDSSLT